MNHTPDPADKKVTQAMEKSVDYLFSLQRADGSWVDTLSSSAISTSVILLALFLTDRERFGPYLQQGVDWLRKTQHSDGGWGDAVFDLSTLNSTTVTVASLKILDKEHSQEALERGLAFIHTHGGWEAVANRSRCTLSDLCLMLLAVAGIRDWNTLPHIPLEIFLIPALRREVSFTMPIVFAWGLLHTRVHKAGPLRRFLQRVTEPKVLDWLRRIITADGGCEESPLLVAVVYVALKVANVGEDICQRILPYLLATHREDGSWPVNRDLEFCATTYVVLGLEAAGHISDPRLCLTRSWIMDRQLSEPFSATNCPSGGWGWSLPSGWPNADDTARGLLVLNRMGLSREDWHLQNARNWLLKMQNRDGSWACFVRNGFVAMDLPCPGITAYALLALCEGAGYPADHPRISRIRRYFARIQHLNGSIHSLWFHNSVAGTAFVLDTYSALGWQQDPVAQKCHKWLMDNQNDDGSWGGSYGEKGTVEETSWALAALMAQGVSVAEERIVRAVAWLVASQNEDGSWPVNAIGIYFSSMCYSSDHITNGYALQALGRYRAKKMQMDRTSTLSTDLSMTKQRD